MTKFRNFLISQSGASLVEYAVALIVVTIVGGAAAIGLGGASGQLAVNADAVVSSACNSGATSANLPTTGC